MESYNERRVLLKRFSSGLLDLVILLLLSFFFIFLLSRLLHFNYYETSLIEYDSSYEDLIELGGVGNDYKKTLFEVFFILLFGVFIAFLLLEFIVPIVLKDGRSIGKRVFLLSLASPRGGEVKVFSLFIRSIIGKYLVETLPILLSILMFFFNLNPTIFVVSGICVWMVNIILLFAFPKGRLIHDILAFTYVVEG